jgi:hypothetical protein
MTGEVRGVLLVGASTMIAECLMPGCWPASTRVSAGQAARLRCRLGRDRRARRRPHRRRRADRGGSAAARAEQRHLPRRRVAVICAPDYPLAGLKKVGAARAGRPRIPVARAGIGNAGDRRRVLPGQPGAAREAEDADGTWQPGERSRPWSRPGSGSRSWRAPWSRGRCSSERWWRFASIRPCGASLYLIQPEDRFRSRLVTTFVQFTRRQLKDLAS